MRISLNKLKSVYIGNRVIKKITLFSLSFMIAFSCILSQPKQVKAEFNPVKTVSEWITLLGSYATMYAVDLADTIYCFANNLWNDPIVSRLSNFVAGGVIGNAAYDYLKSINDDCKDLRNNGGNKNYYTNNNYNSTKNYTVVNYNSSNHTYNIGYTTNNNITNNYTNISYENSYYNISNNTYTFNISNDQYISVSNTYNSTYIIDNGNPVTLYYRLPDGSNSLNMTEEEALNGLKTSLSVASYSNILDSDDLMGLWHFDSNQFNETTSNLELSINPNSVQYVSDDGEFNNALAFDGNVTIGLNTSGKAYSFRFKPMINTNFSLSINSQLLGSTIQQFRTTSTYSEYNQVTTLSSSNFSPFNYTFTTNTSTSTCPSISGYSFTDRATSQTVQDAAGTYRSLYTHSCMYSPTGNRTQTTTIRQYNFINNAYYTHTNLNNLINFNMWNYLYIDTLGRVYLNNVRTDYTVPTDRNFQLEVQSDGQIYLDELAVFRSNKSGISPMLPYQTNVVFTLPGVIYDKVQIPDKGLYGNNIPDSSWNYLKDSDYLFDNISAVVANYFNLVNIYSYDDGGYYVRDLVNGILSDKYYYSYVQNSYNFFINSRSQPDNFYIFKNNYIDPQLTLGVPDITYHTTYTPKINDGIINNQILLQSTVPVVDWKIGGFRPSNPEYGFVYCYVDDLGYIQSVQQFNGTDWIEVQSSIFNFSLMLWISSIGFNVYQNNWDYTAYKYETSDRDTNILISFLQDQFNKIIAALNNIGFNINTDNSSTIQNDYDINIDLDIHDLLNIVNENGFKDYLISPDYSLPESTGSGLQAIGLVMNEFVSTFTENGFGIWILGPLVTVLIGLFI